MKPIHALLALCLAIHVDVARAVQPYEEHEKFLRSAQEIAPLTSEMFGDQVSLYNGTTEFSVTEIDLPGNNALPVRLVRTFNVNSRKDVENLGGFGVWDMDVPYMHGTFAEIDKWGGPTAARCSTNWGPPPPAFPFVLADVFSGLKAHIPGVVSTDVLNRYTGTGASQLVPSDGASYDRLGKDLVVFKCGVNATRNGQPYGEGFMAITPDGTKYRFDVVLERRGGIVRKQIVNQVLGTSVPKSTNRVVMYLMASEVEDRWGNKVNYDYVNSQLVAIRSSDGRRIDITYTGNTITKATANGRPWTFTYQPVTFDPLLNLTNSLLTKVTRPDLSFWSYDYLDVDGCYGVEGACTALLSPHYETLDADTISDSRCPEGLPGIDEFTLRATHPSGAVGEFVFGFGRHHRTNIPSTSCVRRPVPNTTSVHYELINPDYFDVYSLVKKELSGPTIPTQTWTYLFGGHQCRTGSTCPTQKTVTLELPDGSSIQHDFGIAYNNNDGRLLAKRVVSASGQVLRTDTSTYMTDAKAATQPFPDFWGFSFYGPDDPMALKLRPIEATTTTQDGVSFSAQTNTFDAYMRGTSVTRSTSLGYSATETTTYHDNTVKWLLGQVKASTKAGKELSRTDYNSADLPWKLYRVAELDETRTYNADATLATSQDALGKTTTLSGWKRGVAGTVKYADATQQLAEIDDNGWIRSVTDENTFVTRYDYDLMGRIKLIDYPDGDAVAWRSTTSEFARSKATQPEFGLPPDHWKQVVATGNGVRTTHFDEYWRPVVVESYDSGNIAGTRSVVVNQYDVAGRLSFKSNPVSTTPNYNDAALIGTRTAYDALGRVTSVKVDSEFDDANGKPLPLETRTQYLPGLVTKVTNPAGKSTTTTYHSMGEPNYEMPAQIDQPEGVATRIERDVFGNTTEVTRSGPGG